MELKVQLISKETIKPSFPTPQHLRNHKLSFLDQIAPSSYIPSYLLFYSASQEINPKKTSDLLKSSLSKTLTHFYPFAGRVKDGYTINCNDDGAIFIEARVDSDLSTILKEPETDLLHQLLPCDPLEKSTEPSSQVILAVQVNYFACGGMTISVCIKHVVADASAAASFLKIWAAIANGSDVVPDAVIYDCTSLFPPQDLLDSRILKDSNLLVLPEIVAKRFVFDGSKIAALRNEICSGLCTYCPTRVEAVSSLFWSAIIAWATEQSDQEVSMHVAATMVNLRKRMNPPIPSLCMGNISLPTLTSFMAKGNSTNSNKLVEKLHESILKMDDKFVRQIYRGGSFLNDFEDKARNVEMSSKTSFLISSWCRFPFYETDFRCGKPIWFTTVVPRYNRNVIFLDTSDGEGIEAWIALTKEEMAKLERDPGILAYASLNPSIL